MDAPDVKKPPRRVALVGEWRLQQEAARLHKVNRMLGLLFQIALGPQQLHVVVAPVGFVILICAECFDAFIQTDCCSLWQLW